MNTIHGEWVECTKCIHVEDCDVKEDRDGCYFGETERTARWKGAKMGDRDGEIHLPTDFCNYGERED